MMGSGDEFSQTALSPRRRVELDSICGNDAEQGLLAVPPSVVDGQTPLLTAKANSQSDSSVRGGFSLGDLGRTHATGVTGTSSNSYHAESARENEAKGFEICGISSGKLNGEISGLQFADVVKAYNSRTEHEELEALQELGGYGRISDVLKCNFSVGISTIETDLQQRIKFYGRNVRQKQEVTSFWTLCWNAADDFTLRVLMICGIISLVFGVTFGKRPEIEWIEGFGIWTAVMVVILVTAVNDWAKEKQFRKLTEIKDEKYCSVLRNSQLQQLSVYDLLVGDIVLVETGDEVPADCLLIHGMSLSMDESSLTGESDSVKKETLDVCLEQSRERAEELRLAAEGFRHHVIDSPVVLSGSSVVAGTGSLLVIAVGQMSHLGELYGKLSIEVEPTPLQNKLNALARDIGKFGLAAAILTLIVLVTQYWIIWSTQDPSTRLSAGDIGRDHVSFVVTAITILAVAVPEGLPLAVTIALAYSIGRMLKDQSYVRRLAACETMGGADEICSDKTGTLTRNQMAVQAIWNGSQLETDLDASSHLDMVPRLPGGYTDVLADSIAMNSTSFLERTAAVPIPNRVEDYTEIKHVGNPTECALLQFILSLGYDYEYIRKNVYNSEKDIIHREVFNSERKIMTTVVREGSRGGAGLRVFVKGAAEKMIRLCTHRINSKGQVMMMTPSEIDSVEQHVVNYFASLALRTVCVAYKDLSEIDEPNWREPMPGSDYFRMEHGLTCLCITGIRDPVRDEVPAAVRKCQQAGIRVRMVTGDNIETAKQIAIQCNIYHPEAGGVAMLGKDFYEAVGGVVCENCRTERCSCESETVRGSFSIPCNGAGGSGGSAGDDENVGDGNGGSGSGDRVSFVTSPRSRSSRVDTIGDIDRFEEIIGSLEVLARSRPSDKYALVVGLKKRGAVVAVTGDGVNDAPALRKADVGFAMGIAGKEVAKDAADIVILDDNFDSIVKAVKWGRNIYDNIRRFLQFQLTVNVVAVASAFSCALLIRESPLTAVQMLWVNLIMDSFASLALATEPPSDELLDRPPHKRGEYLISRRMFRTIISQALYQFTVMMILVFAGDRLIPESEWRHLRPQDRIAYKFCEFSNCQLSEKGEVLSGSIMVSGRQFHLFSSAEDYKEIWDVEIGPSRHFTFVFNTFVIMQVFNMVNVRKLNNEWNAFGGFFRNPMWILIMAIIVSVQILLVEFGGFAVSCHPEVCKTLIYDMLAHSSIDENTKVSHSIFAWVNIIFVLIATAIAQSPTGLTWPQWVLSIAFGAFGLVIGIISRLIPLHIMPEAGSKEVNPLDERMSLALASRGRMSSERISYRFGGGPACLSSELRHYASIVDRQHEPYSPLDRSSTLFGRLLSRARVAPQ